MTRPSLWFAELAERYRQLGFWTDLTYRAVFAGHARERPGARALSDERRVVAWGEAQAWADALACAFVRRGLPRDAVLATWLPNCVEAYVLRLACEQAGLIWLPIPRSARPRELEPLLRDAGATAVVLAESEQRDHWAELVQVRPSLPVLKQVFLARADRRRAGTELLEALAAETASSAEVAALSGRAVRPEEVVMLQPTSGSTGRPKLCEYVLAGTMARGRAQVELFHITPGDVIAATVTGFGPSITPLLAAPVAGAEVVLLDHPEPAALLRMIEERRITILCGVPAILRDLEPLVAREPERAASIRIWYATGAALPVDVAQRLEESTRGITMAGYGGVDMGCWVASAPDDPPAVRWHTVGRPRGGTEVRLVQDDGGQEVSPGEMGQVWARGPSSTSGYFGSSRASYEEWTPDGWFKTQDIARFEQGGNLVLVGRSVEVINRGGQKVYPTEIEHLLEQHASVACAALVPYPDERLGQRVCAYVVPESDATPTLEELTRHLRAHHLASYKLPERLLAVPKLPLTSGGKLDRQALRADLETRLQTTGAGAAVL